MNRTTIALGVGIAVALAGVTAFAHELRPAYLDLLEVRDGEFAVLWKTPMRSDARLALVPKFPDNATLASEVNTRERSGAAIQEWMLRAPNLRGGVLRIRGIEGTMTDVFVCVSFADGMTWTHLLTPREPAATIAPMTPRAEYRATQETPKSPVLGSLAAWAVVCGASAVVRRRQGGRDAIAVVGTAYFLGIVASFRLIRAIAETLSLT